jgi:uncharacterized RDD family membrane protein YckC
MTVDWKYRTFWRRNGAYLLDFLVVLPLIAAQGALVVTELHPALKTVGYLVCWVVVRGYSAVMHWRYGATLGKMATGVRVIGISEDSLTLRQALVREAINIGYAVHPTIRDVGLIVTSAPMVADSGSADGWIIFVVAGLELGTMLTNAKRRSLDDFIAGTVVVRTRATAEGT